uniref:polynucleotide 3'-phosphatase ZDP-like n=1 Tax=Erigeron canadensis TaxID=72917 RepID=UPI001CB9ACE6|nr:polynucleotide 3'-phosphatase ZDP-like [Erigeron canadensis]
MSSTTTKIVAEYAKSGKSSCKKCSEKIDSKSLRLGLKVWDPRGYDNTKWHHVSCFFALDSELPVFGVDSIEGFQELTGSDQHKLKQMVSETDQVSTKRKGDDESKSERGDLKKLKTDEDKKNRQDKKNVTNEKIIAEYAKSGRSSCNKCSEKIESKSLRLAQGFENTKWYHLDCFFPLDTDLVSADSIEGLSELKSSDEEKLRTLVSKGGQSSKKRDGVDDTESKRGHSKKLKTDEDKENGQEKNNVTNEKIIAEYAKSGRSSCKKCSEKIESKSLRLAFSSWDPRGFENTKWYHLDCFFTLDVDLVSADSIEGFTELKSNDQEKLKTLVIERDQSSK